MASRGQSRPLFASGSQAEWAKINREEAAQDAAFAAKLSIPERLEVGQQLCDQAFGFLNAFRAAGHGPDRDPRA